MEYREDRLLKQRQSVMNALVSYTPYLEIADALLSMLLACYFYSRIAVDIKENARRQEQLQKKETDTQQQIEMVRKQPRILPKAIMISG